MITVIALPADNSLLKIQHIINLQMFINITLGTIVQNVKDNDFAKFIARRDILNKIYSIYSIDSHEIFHFTYIEDFDTFLEAIKKCSKVKIIDIKNLK